VRFHSSEKVLREGGERERERERVEQKINIKISYVCATFLIELQTHASMFFSSIVGNFSKE